MPKISFLLQKIQGLKYLQNYLKRYTSVSAFQRTNNYRNLTNFRAENKSRKLKIFEILKIFATFSKIEKIFVILFFPRRFFLKKLFLWAKNIFNTEMIRKLSEPMRIGLSFPTHQKLSQTNKYEQFYNSKHVKNQNWHNFSKVLGD